MNSEPLNIVVELLERRTARRIQLTDTLWADQHDTDDDLISLAINRQAEQGRQYELLEYQIEPAQMEMF